MFVTYPDRDYLSGCAVPRGSPPDLRPPRRLPARRPRRELRSAWLILRRTLALPPRTGSAAMPILPAGIAAASPIGRDLVRVCPGPAADGHSSFARNSSEDVSHIEIESLKFRGFRAVVE